MTVPLLFRIHDASNRNCYLPRSQMSLLPTAQWTLKMKETGEERIVTAFLVVTPGLLTMMLIAGKEEDVVNAVESGGDLETLDSGWRFLGNFPRYEIEQLPLRWPT